MFGFGQKKPLLDEDTILWMFDCYGWALRNFDSRVFYQETVLVTPSNEHFPGRADHAGEMASLIFGRVQHFAGLDHWPCHLMNANQIQQLELPKVRYDGALRGSEAQSLVSVDESQYLPFVYDEFMLNDPEVLIASYAHLFAHYLGSTAQESLPGSQEYWPFVTELLASFLGFGVIMANTAHTAKIRSCGSCSGPAVERTNFLSPLEMTYALAIFCHLKKIPLKTISRNLKKSLLPFYKKAEKDVLARGADFEEWHKQSTSLA